MSIRKTAFLSFSGRVFKNEKDAILSDAFIIRYKLDEIIKRLRNLIENNEKKHFNFEEFEILKSFFDEELKSLKKDYKEFQDGNEKKACI